MPENQPEIQPPYPPVVLSSTENWVVVSKPAGWLTIPGRDPQDPAPVLGAWLEKERGEKIWVVHRIDRETSGIVLFARSAEAHRQAGIWFQEHRVKKAYDCLAAGNPVMPILRIKSAIEGASSTTQVEVREKFGEAFLARANPLTGRRHQIRIHLSVQGFPLLGDRRYAGPGSVRTGERTLEIARTALHAARLELPSGEVFDAPWPEDFATWVQELRSHG